MLRKNVTRAVRPMLSGLVRRGVGVEALNETPMSDLVEFSSPELTDDVIEEISAGETTVEPVLEMVAATSELNEAHSMMIDDLVDQGAAAVARSIEKARDTVMPAIAKIADAVTKSVDRALHPDNDVLVFKIPSIVTNPTINALFSQYEGGEVDLVTIPDLPQFTSEQLLQLLETGSAEANEQLLDYLAGMPQDALEVIIADVVRGAYPEVVGYTNAVWNGTGARQYIARNVNVLPAVVIGAVVLRNLYDNPPAGINVGIVAWNEQIASALAGLAANYHVILGDVATYVASGQLYLPTTLRQFSDVASNQYPILDRVYDLFLDNGGFPEVLFALTLPESELRMSMQEALANKELLSSKWAAYVENYRGNVMADLSSKARDIVYSEIGKLIGTLDLNELAVSPEEIWDAIRKAGDDSEFTPETLYATIRYLVAGVLFARYRTLEILVAMDKCMADNPDISPRVAAYHGAKAYVCEWVACQLNKTRS